jgi:hypothetical protein
LPRPDAITRTGYFHRQASPASVLLRVR